jgi:hypothetical protein
MTGNAWLRRQSIHVHLVPGAAAAGPRRPLALFAT